VTPDAAGAVDAYLAAQPPGTRERLEQVRALVRELAPEATETMSYGIPTFDLAGTHLVHYAGHARHVGFYPTPEGIEAFAGEFAAAGYRSAKGSVQFPLDRPLPLDLIRRIVEFRLGRLAR